MVVEVRLSVVSSEWTGKEEMSERTRPKGYRRCAAILGVLAACNSEPASAPAAPANTVVQLKPTPAPAVETEPDPIRVALEEGHFDVVCDALVRQAFSEQVCDFLAARARGERGSLNQRALERFLRAQKVRQLRGRIVDVFDRGMSSTTYEVRHGGSTVLLETTDTQFETTGAFRMWAQRTPNNEEVVLGSGRVREIPAYVEWKLADDLLDLARQRSGGEASARRLLDELIVGWEGVWRHEDTDMPEPTTVEQPPPRDDARDRVTEVRERRNTRPARGTSSEGVQSDEFE